MKKDPTQEEMEKKDPAQEETERKDPAQDENEKRDPARQGALTRMMRQRAWDEGATADSAGKILLEEEGAFRSAWEMILRFAPEVKRTEEQIQDALKADLPAYLPEIDPASIQRTVRDWKNNKNIYITRKYALPICFLFRLSYEEADCFLAMVTPEGRLYWRDPEDLPFLYALRERRTYSDAMALKKAVRERMDKSVLSAVFSDGVFSEEDQRALWQELEAYLKRAEEAKKKSAGEKELLHRELFADGWDYGKAVLALAETAEEYLESEKAKPEGERSPLAERIPMEQAKKRAASWTEGKEKTLTEKVKASFLDIRDEGQFLEYFDACITDLGTDRRTAYGEFLRMLGILERPSSMVLSASEKKDEYAYRYENKMDDAEIVEVNLYRRFLPGKKGKDLNPYQKRILSNILTYWPNESMISGMKTGGKPVDRKTLILLFMATDGYEGPAYDESREKEENEDDLWLWMQEQQKEISGESFDGLEQAYPLEMGRKEKAQDFSKRLDTFLVLCGFHELDPRNPFDWMVLYASNEEEDGMDQMMDQRMERLLQALARQKEDQDE